MSSCSDQVVLSPGQLVKQWSKGDRRYFHYKTRHKILKFFPVVSRRFLVKTDSWKDVDIEVYYQEGHEYNIERIINAVKKSLDYMTANFSPYPHKELRVVEFPRYETFAQSFATLIPFSEGAGFIAKSAL
ncbi:MAG: M1 family metallopeptidase [bacterium]|nr:M1 family metallopeptidase [bacterium]